MDLFALDKFLVHFLFGLGAEKLFIYSLFGFGITNTLCINSNKRSKK